VQPGSINPNLFQDQSYKFGSFGNPDKSIRDLALQHTKDSIEIARRLQSREYPCGSRMAPTIPAPPTSVSASNGSRRI